MSTAPVLVLKFGGTSVGTVQRIQHVADLVAAHRKERPQDRLVVVASAMSGETNRLIDLAKQCVKSPDLREMDMLLATGEQVSIALLAMALKERGVPATSMIASQAGISTDGRHTNAQISEIDRAGVDEVFARGEVAVVAGFQGTDPRGDVTTLGRGGSDITAVAFAAALNAYACHIYTDVKGVYTADPRIVPSARLMERVCHEEMLEMASLGAKVLHPRSVYFAMRYAVPLVVRSTFEPGEGTWIVKESELMEKPIVTAITHRVDEAKVTVHELQGGARGLSDIFAALAEADVFVDMISQATAAADIPNISFTVAEGDSERAVTVVRGLLQEIGAKDVVLDKDIAKVSVVGIGMRYHSGVAAKVFAVLSKAGIDVNMIGTSEIKISVAIPQRYCELAVRLLHEAFLEYQPVISVEV